MKTQMQGGLLGAASASCSAAEHLKTRSPRPLLDSACISLDPKEMSR
jgi:hypothetical protein